MISTPTKWLDSSIHRVFGRPTWTYEQLWPDVGFLIILLSKQSTETLDLCRHLGSVVIRKTEGPSEVSSYCTLMWWWYQSLHIKLVEYDGLIWSIPSGIIAMIDWWSKYTGLYPLAGKWVNSLASNSSSRNCGSSSTKGYSTSWVNTRWFLNGGR